MITQLCLLLKLQEQAYVLFPAIIGEKEAVDVCGRFWFIMGDGSMKPL